METLEQLIENYAHAYPQEKAPHEMLEYLKTEDCFYNHNYHGHFTGSAWVVSPDKDQILMNHHKNLGKWLQFGGHADGEEDLLSVAVREAKEESGIQNFTVLSKEIFDMDIHEIPYRMDQPAHRHYDVRFLLEADPFGNKIVISDESYDVAWVSTERAVGLNPEMSIQRMVRKTLLMKNN